IIGSAQDHKRLNNFDEGENTGGMGCSAPPLVLSREMMASTKEKIIGKTIKGLQEEERHYKGILYFGGMMIKEKGQLVSYVIEFNARWGDPEAQVLLPGLTNDLFEVSMAVVGGDIRNLRLRTDKNARVGVAGVSRGYPGDYEKVKGKQLFGLDEARKINGVKIYGAGIKRIDGKYYASGGRLFYIVGRGENVLEARKKAYGAMSLISVEGNNLQFRTDIGYRDVERLRNM
ncbi:phosphoribosylamine--glycine ligase, partial [Patescibacteria group bacterium]|nr:phosphoribosylamine--glycine ligase [Patescibacteria group bacterium]